MSAEAGALYSGFTTTEMVNDLIDSQRISSAGLTYPALLEVVLTGNQHDPAFKANAAYAQRLVTHGEQIGTATNIYTPASEDEAIRLIKTLNDNVAVNGILPLLPAATSDFDAQLRGAVDPRKDVDGVNPVRLFKPATPEAMILTAEYIFGQPLHSELGSIAIVGDGAVVGKPLEEMLIARGIPQPTVFRRPEIEAGLEGLAAFNLVFSAVPKYGILTRDNINPHAVVIDAGFGRDPLTGNYGGNANPDLANSEEVLFTAFRNGVGPVTAAVIHERTLQNAINNTI